MLVLQGASIFKNEQFVRRSEAATPVYDLCRHWFWTEGCTYDPALSNYPPLPIWYGVPSARLAQRGGRPAPKARGIF